MRESKERAAGQINHNQFQRHTKSLILIELAAERNSLLHSFRKFISFNWGCSLLVFFGGLRAQSAIGSAEKKTSEKRRTAHSSTL